MSKSENQVFDFEKICRLCLGEKRSMSAIFTKKKSDKKVPLPVRIMSCASLELFEGDGMPTSICNKCLVTVNASYAFREQCEQADTTLRRYAAQQQEKEGKVEELDEQPQEQEYEEEDDEEQEDMQQEEAEQGDSEDQTEPSPSTEDANTCTSPEHKVEMEESTAYDYLQVEVRSPAAEVAHIKTEKSEFDHNLGSFSDSGEHWADDDTEPLAVVKQEMLKAEQESDNEPKVPKLKIPIRRRGEASQVSKPPKRCRILKPQFIDCEVCGKSVQRRKFKLHMMVHNGDKPHLCDTCGKSFTWKFALVTHKRVHSGEKPYLCKHCGQSFRSSSRFAEHSTIHTGRRSYVCERCALAFRTSGRLKRHLRIHTGEKPYICSYCERGFSESYNLKQHQRLHTGEKPPHVCSICTQAFIRKKMLVDHLKINHGIVQPTAQMLALGQHQLQQQQQQQQAMASQGKELILGHGLDGMSLMAPAPVKFSLPYEDLSKYNKNFIKDM